MKTNISKLTLVRNEANAESTPSSNEENDDVEVEVKHPSVHDEPSPFDSGDESELTLPNQPLVDQIYIKTKSSEASPIADALFQTPKIKETFTDHEKKRKACNFLC